MVGDLAPTLQSLMDDWAEKAPGITAIYDALNAGERSDAIAVDAEALESPFPACLRMD